MWNLILNINGTLCILPIYRKVQKSQKCKMEMDGPLCGYHADLIVNVITMDKCGIMCGKRTYICVDHIQEKSTMDNRVCGTSNLEVMLYLNHDVLGP